MINYHSYEVNVETGQVFNTKTKREVGKNKRRIVLDTGREVRKNQLKIRFIYEMANGKLMPGDVVIPINGDYTDCRIENIKMVNRKEYFEGHDWSTIVKLTKDDKEEVINRRNSGQSYTQIANEMRIGKSTIYKVLKGNYNYEK